MNPLAIESAFKTALAVSFPTAVIHTGTSYEEIPPETTTLVISVENLSTVGLGLYTATAMIRLMSPALLGAESYDDFSDALDDLKNVTTQASLLTKWPTNDAPNLCGAWLSSISTSNSGNAWQADLTMTIGVMD
jgi:hypothetical protein